MSNILMTAGELANEFFPGFCLKWVYKELNAGRIPGAFKQGGTWLIHRTKFLEGIEAKAQKPQKKETVLGKHGL